MNDQAATSSITSDTDDREVDVDQPPSTSGSPAAPSSIAHTDQVSDVRVELNLNTADTDPPIEGWIDVELLRMAHMAGVSTGRICIALVDDVEMAKLHERYKGVAGTTDVLTFDLRSHADEPIDVDIVICRDEAARQAAKRNHETRMELLLYALHGLLHVTGYDDVDQAAAQTMHAREDELLVAAGFPSIFAGHPTGSPPLEVRDNDCE